MTAEHQAGASRGSRGSGAASRRNQPRRRKRFSPLLPLGIASQRLLGQASGRQAEARAAGASGPRRQRWWQAGVVTLAAVSLLVPLWLHQHQPIETEALERELGLLRRWLQQADRGLGRIDLEHWLQRSRQRLARDPADACLLISRAELLELGRRLELDLASQAPATSAATPSWQQRYGSQLKAAAWNLRQCRT